MKKKNTLNFIYFILVFSAVVIFYFVNFSNGKHLYAFNTYEQTAEIIKNDTVHNTYFNWNTKDINGKAFFVTNQFKNESAEESFFLKANHRESKSSKYRDVWVTDLESSCVYFNVFNESLKSKEKISDVFSKMHKEQSLFTLKNKINTEESFGCYKENDNVYIYMVK